MTCSAETRRPSRPASRHVPLAFVLLTSFVPPAIHADEEVAPSGAIVVREEPATPLASRAEEPETRSEVVAQPMVDVVFVLDTTGSMSGLIAAAKEKIWSIANSLATAKPAPSIRMGLVAYRDRSDAYVTRLVPLTEDLDAVYVELMGFQAQGGGDTPESVNAALAEAVGSMEWRRDESAYRVVFLVGDAPPHEDYEDDIPWADSCRRAAESGIAINTIQCGNVAGTRPIWEQIAAKAEGRYFGIDASGGQVLAATPFDAELVELSKRLDDTRRYYGEAEGLARQAEREERAKKIYDGASVRSQARRVLFNCMDAGKANWIGQESRDLVTDWAEGAVNIASIADEELPEGLRELTIEERVQHVQDLLDARRAVRERIDVTAVERELWIAAEKAKASHEPELDEAIWGCVKEQAARRGIAYTGGPRH